MAGNGLTDWLGALHARGAGDLSRNRTVGLRLGRGERLEDIQVGVSGVRVRVCIVLGCLPGALRAMRGQKMLGRTVAEVACVATDAAMTACE